MKYISKAPISRLIHDAGGKRISNDIVEEIGERAEAYALALAKKAVFVAKLQESQTIKRKHLLLALDMEQQRNQ